MRVFAIARAAGGGDLHPVVALALGLSRRGHEIITLSDAPGTPLPEELQPFVDEKLFATAVSRGRAAVATLGPAPRKDEMYARYFETVNSALREPLRDHIRRVAPDYVIAPRLVAPATAEAVDDALPWCVVNSTYSLHADDDLYAVNQQLAPAFLRATLVVHATDEAFDGAHPLPDREHRVGPLFWEPSDQLPDYVTEPGPPWTLVAISSVPQGDVELAAAALAALARHDVRVVATIGPNDPRACAEVPANAHLERFVSHLAFLEHAILLVSHAGHGSVMKGLWTGVPMVLVPWDRDQPGVAARAERLGVARIVQPSDLGTIGGAIDEVMQDDRYREAAQHHSGRIRSRDPLARACDLVELSAGG